MSKLAGYIGAATIDLAWVESKAGLIELKNPKRFDTASFRDLSSVLRRYIKKHECGDDEKHQACFGIAGPVLENSVATTNLPWRIEGRRLEDEFPFEQVRLINDTVATAHGLTRLGEDKFFIINGAATASQIIAGQAGQKISSSHEDHTGHADHAGHVGLIAAGSGLGQALIFCDGKSFHPYASEGGHTDFAPTNQTEIELWGYIYAEKGRVEVEDVLSHAGLETIYLFVSDSAGLAPAEWFEHADQRYLAIIEMALAGNDEQAVRALDIFIDCYASEAANLALKGMTLGGVFIGGTIAPRILTALDKGRFMERFVKRGKMESILAKIPVGVIIEEKAPLIGAADMVLRL